MSWSPPPAWAELRSSGLELTWHSGSYRLASLAIPARQADYRLLLDEREIGLTRQGDGSFRLQDSIVLQPGSRLTLQVV